jgi:hypothetical protein
MLKTMIVVLSRGRVGLGEFNASEGNVRPARSHGPYEFTNASLLLVVH